MMQYAYTKSEKPDHDHSYDSDRISRHDQPNDEDNAVIEWILNRGAATYYDLAATLSEDQLRDLVRIGTGAPTSFRMQN
jgi:hypothetical protein